MNIQNPFTLPELQFVGGATQELVFRCYHEQNGAPSELSSCSANFSIVSYVHKNGLPQLSKAMTIREGSGEDAGIGNVLCVTLTPRDTVNLQGKYIYQITIMDATGVAEIPHKGLMHIENNINKGIIS